MRRLAVLLLILALTFSCALAEGTYFRIPAVLVVQAGNPVTIDCRKIKNTPEGELSVKDAGGNVLAKTDTIAGGAGGKYTMEIARRLQNADGVETLAHLTCVGASRETVGEYLQTMKDDTVEIKAEDTLDVTATRHAVVTVG